MASAIPQAQPEPESPETRPYFCHQCNHRWMKSVDAIFQCPECNEGFIEEVTSDRSDFPINPAPGDIENFLTQVFRVSRYRIQAQMANNRASRAGTSSRGSRNNDRSASPRLQSRLSILVGGTNRAGNNEENNDNGNNNDYRIRFGRREGFLTFPLEELMTTIFSAAPRQPMMTNTQLEEIPKAIITAEEVAAQIQCAVCFDEYNLNQNDVRKLPCNHLFHEKCIFPWLKNNATCPVCRARMPNVTEGNESDDSEVDEGMLDHLAELFYSGDENDFRTRRPRRFVSRRGENNNVSRVQTRSQSTSREGTSASTSRAVTGTSRSTAASTSSRSRLSSRMPNVSESDDSEVDEGMFGSLFSGDEEDLRPQRSLRFVARRGEPHRNVARRDEPRRFVARRGENNNVSRVQTRSQSTSREGTSASISRAVSGTSRPTVASTSSRHSSRQNIQISYPQLPSRRRATARNSGSNLRARLNIARFENVPRRHRSRPAPPPPPSPPLPRQENGEAENNGELRARSSSIYESDSRQNENLGIEHRPQVSVQVQIGNQRQNRNPHVSGNEVTRRRFPIRNVQVPEVIPPRRLPTRIAPILENGSLRLAVNAQISTTDVQPRRRPDRHAHVSEDEPPRRRRRIVTLSSDSE